MSKKWALVVCVICIALAILCGYLNSKWQEEKAIRIVIEELYDISERTKDHYQQLWYDCINEESSSRWSEYIR